MSIIEAMMQMIGGKMKRNKDEPLYGDDKCPVCGGEVVKVRGGQNPVFACWECGKRV